MQIKNVLFIEKDLIASCDNTGAAIQFGRHAISVLSGIASMKIYQFVLFDFQKSDVDDKMRDEVDTLIKRAMAAEDIEYDNVVMPSLANMSKDQTIKAFEAYSAETYNMSGSYLVSKSGAGITIAGQLGLNIIYMGTTTPSLPAKNLTAIENWKQVYEFLRMPVRSAQVIRKTNETDIVVTVNLDGTGISTIDTGLGFFDHMLNQLARHGNIDLEIRAKGDLHIDEHHTIEDTGIALGEAFIKALGDKRGIERYGFCLPMDDCLARVAIDFGGRNWIVWEADFKREKIGEMPTEMFFHFFKSFSDAAKCNLNIMAEGINEHHKIEAIFKCFAKAIKMAVKRNADNMQLPTTKGVL